MTRTLLPLAILLLLSGARDAGAQFMPPLDLPDMAIDQGARDAVVDQLLAELDRGYVFPEKAAAAGRAIRQRVKKGEYAAITSASEFADSLTSHLQAVTHDKHLRVRYSDDVLTGGDDGPPSPEEMEKFKRVMARRNFGFEKVERLAGNVGYLDIRGFMQPDRNVSEAAVAAMNFLAHTDALIIDLRQNGGGSPETVALITTYLFPEMERVHLNDLYFRPADETTQFWTLPYVPGTRYDGKDVYVLTSRRTFSAAEEFTYNLKNLKRATIVGEVTGGGAHPGGFRPIHDHFGVFVPSGRAINPISKTNWEGTGVEPDVAVAADDALSTAHVLALRKLREASRDEDEQKELDQAIAAASQKAEAP